MKNFNLLILSLFCCFSITSFSQGVIFFPSDSVQCTGSAFLIPTEPCSESTSIWVDVTNNDTLQLTGYMLDSLCAGNIYSVSFTNCTGQIITIIDTITVPNPCINFMGNTLTSNANQANDGLINVHTFYGTAPYTYLSNGITSTSMAPSFVDTLPSGVWCINITDSNNCQITLCDTIEMQPCLNAGTDSTITIYESEPFVFNDLLSINTYQYGTWRNYYGNWWSQPYNNFDTTYLSFNIYPYNFAYVVYDQFCGNDTAYFDITVLACLSAGNSSTITMNQSEPFVLNDLLTSNVYEYGTWLLGSQQFNNFDTIQLNFPGQYNFNYIVNDTICNTSDTAFFIINIQSGLGWGIDEINYNKISIYPNPTTNGVINLSKDINYYIEDVTGKKVDNISKTGVYYIVIDKKRYKLINL